MHHLIESPRFRSAIRFAVGLSVANLVLHHLFGDATAALLGSFAVAIHLYFLDFDGDLRERTVGVVTATFVGAAAIFVGVLCASPLWLAVAVALVVSFAFAFARLLRGYVGRSAVGLQGAFFLPLMVESHMSDAPKLLGGWFVGSAVALVVALAVLPHRRTGRVRALLANWARAAADLCTAVSNGGSIADEIDQLRDRRDALLGEMTGCFSQPGAVGRRQRALAGMMDGARWSMPIAAHLESSDAHDPTTLARTSADAFRAAADLVGGGAVRDDVPDIPTARTDDLEQLVELDHDVQAAHYPVRLLSIGAMNQLLHAAHSRDRSAPEPDVGRFASTRPTMILRQNLSLRSLWLRNALRTGAGAALCVLIVRLIGIDHGVWVVMAALVVTQVTISGSASTSKMVKIVAGAGGGVLFAGLVSALHLPFMVFVIALPFVAFLAKWEASTGMGRAQFMYTLFALINFNVLTWPPHAGIELVRIEDIALGAGVAAVFSLLAFPSGITKLLSLLRSDAQSSSRQYLQSRIAELTSGVEAGASDRDAVLDALGAYESAVDAAFMHDQTSSAELMEHEKASEIARDLLVGGDACDELFAMSRRDARFVPIGRDMATWWGSFLSAH